MMSGLTRSEEKQYIAYFREFLLWLSTDEGIIKAIDFFNLHIISGISELIEAADYNHFTDRISMKKKK